MKLLFSVTLLSSLLAFAWARLTIIDPVLVTEWEFGKTETVKWKCDNDTSGAMDLYLYYTRGAVPELFDGDYVEKMEVPDVTTEECSFDLSKIDTSKFPETSKNYFVRFGDVKGFYSSLFTIKGGSCANCTEIVRPNNSTSITNSTQTNTTTTIKPSATATNNENSGAKENTISMMVIVFALVALLF